MYVPRGYAHSFPKPRDPSSGPYPVGQEGWKEGEGRDKGRDIVLVNVCTLFDFPIMSLVETSVVDVDMADGGRGDGEVDR